MITKLTGGGANTSSQDAFMVLNYVKSRAIVADLGGRDYMEKKFARSGIDYFSRLGRNANAEEIWKYWLSHISASVDTLSGILTVRTDAFQPKDALDVARDIVRLSEELVNKITVRNRTDALSRAELEVTLSRQMLADAREKTLQFRNKNVIIDPGSRATSIGELLGKLTDGAHGHRQRAFDIFFVALQRCAQPTAATHASCRDRPADRGPQEEAYGPAGRRRRFLADRVL